MGKERWAMAMVKKNVAMVSDKLKLVMKQQNAADETPS